MEYSDSVGVNSDGYLTINGILPHAAGESISISKATMSDSALERVTIKDSPSIKTSSLSVTGPAEISEDVYIQGRLTVDGSVMGSGPYMDSSDVRFKKNIVPISNALDKVCTIGGDYFEYRIDEYPNRGFEAGRQVGWVADEVEKVAPELVREDSDGFKSVAYARSSALLAAAVKEMKENFAMELDAVIKELRSTQDEVEALKKQLEAIRKADQNLQK